MSTTDNTLDPVTTTATPPDQLAGLQRKIYEELKAHLRHGGAGMSQVGICEALEATAASQGYPARYRCVSSTLKNLLRCRVVVPGVPVPGVPRSDGREAALVQSYCTTDLMVRRYG